MSGIAELVDLTQDEHEPYNIDMYIRSFESKLYYNHFINTFKLYGRPHFFPADLGDFHDYFAPHFRPLDIMFGFQLDQFDPHWWTSLAFYTSYFCSVSDYLFSAQSAARGTLTLIHVQFHIETPHQFLMVIKNMGNLNDAPRRTHIQVEFSIDQLHDILSANDNVIHLHRGGLNHAPLLK